MVQELSGNTRSSLKAELAHARKGMSYYEKRVAKISRQLDKLKSRAGGKGRASADLPRTSSEFWLSLLGKRPKTTRQVMDSALRKLQLEDAPQDLVKKLNLRWSVTLLGLVRKGYIRDEGRGRQRTFTLGTT